MAEKRCREICLEVFDHLHKKDTFCKMFDWNKDNLPNGESMNEIKREIDSQIRKKVSAEIMSKMKRIEIENLSDFVKELFEWQQLAIGKECGELDRVFQGETNVVFTFDEHRIDAIFSLPKRSFTTEEKIAVIVSSPFWVPTVLIVGAVSTIIVAPILMGVQKLRNRLENKKKLEEYNYDKIKYANEKAEKYLSQIPFESLFSQMQNGFLKNIKERIDRYFTDVIPKRIAAGEALIRNIERDIRPPCEIRKQCHRVEMEVMPIYGRIILAYVDLFEEKVVSLTDIRALSLPSSNLRQSCETELSVEGQWIPVHVSKITCASDDKDKCAELAEIHLLRYDLSMSLELFLVR